MRRGQLDDLIVFATIAKARSFTRAAVELNVSPSALSHTIKELERRLGVRLLARTTRSVAPTPAGERLFRSVQAAVEEVEAGLEALSDWGGDPSGSIKITVSHFAAHSVLMPVLPQFLLKFPKISIEIGVDDRMNDLVRDGFDAGIGWGDNVAQDMVSVRVGPETRLIVVGAPSYFTRYSKPQSPSDLDRHNCIGCRVVNGGGQLPWKLYRLGEEVRTSGRGQLILDDPDIASILMFDGVGVGLMAEQAAASYLEAGRLVQVLEDWYVPFQGLHIYYPHRQTTPALRALIEAIRWKSDETADDAAGASPSAVLAFELRPTPRKVRDKAARSKSE